MSMPRSIGKKNIIGERIKQIRNWPGVRMSQTELVAKLQVHGVDIDQSAISRIETGERAVNDVELAAIASIFNLSTDYLLYGNQKRQGTMSFSNPFLLEKVIDGTFELKEYLGLTDKRRAELKSDLEALTVRLNSLLRAIASHDTPQPARRVHPRFLVDVEGQLRLKGEANPYDCRLEDLSGGGCRIAAGAALIPNEEVYLSFSVEGMPVNVWCQGRGAPRIDQSTYGAGLLFLNLAEDLYRHLMDFLLSQVMTL